MPKTVGADCNTKVGSFQLNRILLPIRCAIRGIGINVLPVGTTEAKESPTRKSSINTVVPTLLDSRKPHAEIVIALCRSSAVTEGSDSEAGSSQSSVVAESMSYRVTTLYVLSGSKSEGNMTNGFVVLPLLRKR